MLKEHLFLHAHISSLVRLLEFVKVDLKLLNIALGLLIDVHRVIVLVLLFILLLVKMNDLQVWLCWTVSRVNTYRIHRRSYHQG